MGSTENMRDELQQGVDLQNAAIRLIDIADAIADEESTALRPGPIAGIDGVIVANTELTGHIERISAEIQEPPATPRRLREMLGRMATSLAQSQTGGVAQVRRIHEIVRSTGASRARAYEFHSILKRVEDQASRAVRQYDEVVGTDREPTTTAADCLTKAQKLQQAGGFTAEIADTIFRNLQTIQANATRQRSTSGNLLRQVELLSEDLSAWGAHSQDLSQGISSMHNLQLHVGQSLLEARGALATLSLSYAQHPVVSATLRNALRQGIARANAIINRL